MDLGLAGLKAVVTGGSSGIGAAIVRTLAAEGCAVAFCARSRDGIDALTASTRHLPGDVAGTALDVTDAAAVAVSSPMAGFVAGANWYVDGGAAPHVQI